MTANTSLPTPPPTRSIGLDADVARCALEPARPRGDGGYRTFRFDAGFLGFQGHFPDDPAVPAIAQIIAAVDSIAACLSRPLVLSSVLSAKFRRVVRPGETVLVSWSRVERENRPQWRCKLTCGDEAVADFTLILREEA